jgi:hypothetical protein
MAVPPGRLHGRLQPGPRPVVGDQPRGAVPGVGQPEQLPVPMVAVALHRPAPLRLLMEPLPLLEGLERSQEAVLVPEFPAHSHCVCMGLVPAMDRVLELTEWLHLMGT